MNINDFIQLVESKTGKNVQKLETGSYSSCCPAHEDSNPSFSISEAADGKILIKCHAGCSSKDICAALGITEADLFPAKIDPESILKEKTQYPYHDEEGKILYSKIRIEPGFDGKSKSFFYEHIDTNGNIVKNLNGCKKTLYNLPSLLKGIQENKPIFLVEGEKDANKLIEHGLIATTAPETLHWQNDFSDILKDADVVVLYDQDRTGIERKDLLCKQLHGNTKRLRVIDLPNLKYQESHGEDISDWLSNGNTITKLLEIVDQTVDYTTTPKSNKITVITINDFLNLELPEREMLISPILPTQGLGLLYAKRGVGKTHVALGIANAVASGSTFFKWQAPKPRKVLYIDGEMPAIVMQERLRRISVTNDLQPPSSDFLQFITPDLQDGHMPDLSTKEGRDLIDELIENIDLIIIDNISTLFRSGIENEAESWCEAQEWALDLRRRGKSVLFVHHAAKNGQQRGTSKKEDILDTVISLKNPDGYKANQGACFEVSFEKARHFVGDDASSFLVTLEEQDDGLWNWKIDDISIDSEVLLVAEKIKEGLTIQEIVKETELTKSQVETRKKKAKDQGLIQ
jgi:5S rRNA maturation endonuclease (ribonuclease M5)